MLTEQECSEFEAERVLSCAQTLREVETAWGLVYDTYLSRQLIKRNPFQVYAHPQAFASSSCVVRARVRDRTVATLTAIPDGKLGLPSDAVAPDIMDTLRRGSRCLVEAGLLASCGDDRSQTVSQLLELLSWAIWFSVHKCADELIIGVHPNHASFYQRALTFRRLTSVLSYPSLGGAPVVLMALRVPNLFDAAHPQAARGLRYARSHRILKRSFDRRYRFPDHVINDLDQVDLLRMLSKVKRGRDRAAHDPVGERRLSGHYGVIQLS